MEYSESQREEKVIGLLKEISFLPEHIQRWAFENIKALKEGVLPAHVFNRVSCNPMKEFQDEYPAVKIKHKCSPATLKKYKRKGDKIYKFLVSIMDDKSLTDEMRLDAQAMLYQHFPYWRLWRIADRPRRKGPPSNSNRNFVVYQLVRAYCLIGSKKKAYEHVSNIMALIGMKVSPETVRSTFEKEEKRYRKAAAYLDSKENSTNR